MTFQKAIHPHHVVFYGGWWVLRGGILFLQSAIVCYLIGCGVGGLINFVPRKMLFDFETVLRILVLCVHTVVYPHSGCVCWFLRSGIVCPQSASVCCLIRGGGE